MSRAFVQAVSTNEILIPAGFYVLADSAFQHRHEMAMKIKTPLSKRRYNAASAKRKPSIVMSSLSGKQLNGLLET